MPAIDFLTSKVLTPPKNEINSPTKEKVSLTTPDVKKEDNDEA
jgi:hypothetical protein